MNAINTTAKAQEDKAKIYLSDPKAFQKMLTLHKEALVKPKGCPVPKDEEDEQ